MKLKDVFVVVVVVHTVYNRGRHGRLVCTYFAKYGSNPLKIKTIIIIFISISYAFLYRSMSELPVNIQ